MNSTTFEFGFAKEDITPAYGIPLCGYFNPRPNKGFYDRLHVKAAAFRCGEEYAAIVSCDLAFVTYDVIKELEETLQKEQCPLAGKTMFTATHTHTGPYPSTLFAFDNENNSEYISEMKDFFSYLD